MRGVLGGQKHGCFNALSRVLSQARLSWMAGRIWIIKAHLVPCLGRYL